MKVCVPSLGDGDLDTDVSQHFGRAPTYVVYDTETESIDVHENDSDHRGGSDSPPQTVVETGADTLVCVHLGQRAMKQFHEMDVPVYCGADGTVRNAIEQFQAGDLERARPGGDNCGGHDHDHDHEHGHSDHDHEHGHSDHEHETDHTRGDR